MSPAFTEATQWFERTLDDSANKRLSIPQMFLGADAALRIAVNVTSGLAVYPAVIRRHIVEELPFIATEDILMRSVIKGGDRQLLHEEIRRLAQEAGYRVKTEGSENDLIDRILQSGKFPLNEAELQEIMAPEKYVGRAPEQVEDFIAAEVDPVLEKEKDCPEIIVGLNV